jgi:hypothetical protein
MHAAFPTPLLVRRQGGLVVDFRRFVEGASASVARPGLCGVGRLHSCEPVRQHQGGTTGDARQWSHEGRAAGWREGGDQRQVCPRQHSRYIIRLPNVRLPRHIPFVYVQLPAINSGLLLCRCVQQMACSVSLVARCWCTCRRGSCGVGRRSAADPDPFAHLPAAGGYVRFGVSRLSP